MNIAKTQSAGDVGCIGRFRCADVFIIRRAATNASAD
jgi:hypothetical protein